jgi:SAM-dependent methyltransferase
MIDSIRETELVTDENLSEIGYLDANPDVRTGGFTARAHFELHGRLERRRQHVGYPTEREEKYERFKKLLIPPYDALANGKFPLIVGDAHHDLSNYASESANEAYSIWDHELASNPAKNYLDLGCGYRKHTFGNCLYVEVYNSRSADLIVEPNCTYPIRDSALDGIGCFAVLEHTRKPWLVVAEMQRMLKPGGKVFIDWPFLQPVHGYPSHFFNATREGLISIFEDAGFAVESCKTEVNQTPAYTMRWVVGAMAARLPANDLREEFLAMSIGDLIGLDPHGATWAKFLDGIDAAAFSELACGNFLIGTKADR